MFDCVNVCVSTCESVCETGVSGWECDYVFLCECVNVCE